MTKIWEEVIAGRKRNPRKTYRREIEMINKPCIICNSGEILELKCKIICQNCGYKQNCSDS